MSNKITAKEYALSDIFSKKFDYHIPGYQRPYAWEKEQTETLFDDLYSYFLVNSYYKTKSTGSYFLGSVILIKEDDDSRPRSDVVDGQQRLTTLTILFAVLLNKIKDAKFKSAFTKYIIQPGDPVERRNPEPRVHLRNVDRDFFEAYIQREDGKVDDLLKINPTDEVLIKNESQRHIRENCGTLDSLVAKNFCDGNGGYDDAKLKEFARFLINECWMVVVSATNQDSAYRIFSVMNSTGLDLSTTDILKSDLIGKIDSDVQQAYTDKWEEMEIRTGRQGFVDLFSHIRMIETRKKAGQSILAEFRNEIIPKYSPRSFIDDILEPYVNYYVEIRECSFCSPVHGEEIKTCFRWLNKISNSDWVPPMLLFMKKHRGDDGYILWFCRKLERLAAYLLITNKYTNDRIDRYSEILRETKKERNGSVANPLKSVELTDGEKKEFAACLDGDIYVLLSSKAKNYLMLRLDSFVAGEGVIFDYNPKVLTIEHVLPQKVNPMSEWARTWPDENDRTEWEHRIGNLLPLARRANSAAQNYDFERKKREYFLGRNGVAPYALTSQVSAETEWTPDVVRRRQADLMKTLRDKWELG